MLTGRLGRRLFHVCLCQLKRRTFQAFITWRYLSGLMCLVVHSSVWWDRHSQPADGPDGGLQQHRHVCQLHQNQRQLGVPHHRDQRVRAGCFVFFTHSDDKNIVPLVSMAKISFKRPTDMFNSTIEWIISPSSFFSLQLLWPSWSTPLLFFILSRCPNCSHFCSLLHLIISKAAIMYVFSDNKELYIEYALVNLLITLGLSQRRLSQHRSTGPWKAQRVPDRSGNHRRVAWTPSGQNNIRFMSHVQMCWPSVCMHSQPTPCSPPPPPDHTKDSCCRIKWISDESFKLLCLSTIFSPGEGQAMSPAVPTLPSRIVKWGSGTYAAHR